MVLVRRSLRMLVGLVVSAGALFLSACSGSFPSPPAAVGDDYPGGGVPADVTWPSDWLEGFVAEPSSPPGPIVGLRLEYLDDQWVWRVRSLDPGRDLWGESVTDPDRGQEALYDASTLARVQQRHVTLTQAEQAEASVSAYDAAQLSGEMYPGTRLIELERILEDGRPGWAVTTYDTETGVQSVATLEAG